VGFGRAENHSRVGLPFQATGQSISNKARLSVWHYPGAHQHADNAAKLCGLACGPGADPNKNPHNINDLDGMNGGEGVLHTFVSRSPRATHDAPLSACLYASLGTLASSDDPR
jgi:hypothetical protein